MAGTLVISPYIFPALGITDNYDTLELFKTVCGNSQDGVGIAGGANNLLRSVPMIGSILESGSYATATASGVIGIGGTVLGKKLERNHDGKGINWGNVIKTAAITTSLLISLPALLTGVSMGIIFLASTFGSIELAEDAIKFTRSTIGSIGVTQAASSGVGGGMALIPHLITCGASFFPAATSYFMAKDDDASVQQNTFLAPNIAPHPLLAQANNVALSTSATAEGITARISTQGKPVAGLPSNATITLTHTADGTPLSAEEIAVTHTEKLHLMLIDSSMTDYQHIHPQPTNEAGIFNFTYTPQTNNPMSAWADFTVQSDGKNPHIHVDMPAEPPIAPPAPAKIIHNDQAVSGDLVFHWHAQQPLKQGDATIVELAVTDRQGNSIKDLEPVMGAYCHLVGFSADGKDFIHSHPMGEEPQSDQERGGPVLRFHVQPERSGDIQFFAQVKHQGEMIYVPFGQNVQQEQKHNLNEKPNPLITHAAHSMPMQQPIHHNHSAAR